MIFETFYHLKNYKLHFKIILYLRIQHESQATTSQKSMVFEKYPVDFGDNFSNFYTFTADLKVCRFLFSLLKKCLLIKGRYKFDI